MTDFQSMTDQELNEWIAKKRGWVKESGIGKFSYPSYWHKSGEYTRIVPPDYCNDWKWAGELEEDGKFTIAYDLHMETWFIYPPDANTFSDNYIGKNVVLPRAISEAHATMTETLGDMTKKDGEG